MPEQRTVALATAGGGFLVESFTGAISLLAGRVVSAPVLETLGVGAVILIGIPVLGFIAIGGAAQRAEGDTPFFDNALPIVYTLLAFIGLVIIWNHYRSIRDIATVGVGLLLLLAIASILRTYFSRRQRHATRSTAVRNARRDVQRDFQDYGQFIFGALALIVAVAIGLFQGGLEAWSTAGDSIVGILPELAYIFTVLSGYLAQGGEIFGMSAGWLQSMSPWAWAGFVLFIGGLAIAFRD